MSKNNFNFGFQPIQDFTFDQCFSRIENNRNSGIENDEELLTHYTKLLCQLQQRDDTLYKKASTKKELQIYLSSYPLDSTAKNYHLRHAEKALKRIAKIEENEKVGKKKKIVSVLSFVAIAIIAVCLFNYEPVKYLNVGDTLTCSKYGDSIRLEVQTNVPSSLLKVDLDSSCKWLQVLGKDGNYNLVIKQNPIGSRNTIIKISAPNRLFGETVSWDYKTINISQESGIPTYITPERKSISFDKFGKPLDKSDLIISTDGVLESATSKPDWCDISFKHLNSGRYRCIVTMDKNNGECQKGHITLKGGGITQNIVIQQESGLASHIEFKDNNISVSPKEDTVYVDVITDGTSWSIISKPDWIIASDNGNNSLKLVVHKNDNDKREGVLMVKSNNGHASSLLINQCTSKASFIKTDQTSIFAESSGLDKYISVITDGTEWSVYSKPDWLSLTPNYDSNKLYVEIPLNSGKVKEGEIILASNNGQYVTISVNQDGDPTNFCAAKSSIRFDTDSDYEYLDINNNSNQSLRVNESKDWITASVISKECIKISVRKNSNSPRSGYVTVYCGNESYRIDIRQSGWTDCYLCRGRGQVQCHYPALWMNGVHIVQKFVINNYTGYGDYSYDSCPNCGGYGGVKCTHCKGNGKIKTN